MGCSRRLCLGTGKTVVLVAAGVVGVLLGMLSYFLVVTGRGGPAYLYLNVAATVLVLLSLTEQFNLPALLINIFYGGVSIWGIFKCSMKNSTSSSV